MALIQPISPEQAEGKLAELYATTAEFFGSVPSNVQLFGVNPAVLENQIQFAMSFTDHPTLSPIFFSLVRMLVAHGSKSPYCDTLNAGLMAQQGMSAEEIEAMRTDPSQAPLEEKEKALLQFVLKAAADPQGVAKADIDGLREMGFAEKDIFDAVTYGARSVYANIIFDVFKLESD